ncbi:hypothetical protein OG936_00375 [Streptomyces sp. NBC_00846]|uniref:hypothetical protein n=1 Tax=Streptomyces sp. NBC_00846 TaxID=2975849 RepID=UPI00386A06C9|nr:hypothetical protein OG936_00375 [Streptomyces sp. NBC_00846]
MHDARHRMLCIEWTPLGGLHSRAHRLTVDSTLVRTTIRHRTGAHHPTMPGTLARTRCAASMSPAEGTLRCAQGRARLVRALCGRLDRLAQPPPATGVS